MERWVEIRERSGRLVTVIELLSPHNKGTGAGNYRSKQDDIMRSGVNLTPASGPAPLVFSFLDFRCEIGAGAAGGDWAAVCVVTA